MTPNFSRGVCCACGLLMMLATASPLLAQRGPLRGFDAYIAQAVRDWEVPGMAVAVVKDDSVVYARGFGVRRLGDTASVDRNTVFAAASTTKAFTATALAMLVDEGKVRWDDPVIKYVPEFQLSDPYITRELTVRDLLTHRSGVGTVDMTWYASGNDFPEILRRLRHQEMASSLRSRYAYQNVMYGVAGEVVGRASGMPWEEFVRRRILEPLGMHRTLTGYDGLEAANNVATPHLEIDDTIRAISYRNLDNIGPAGSMNTSVADMARWIKFQLDTAQVNGKQLVSDSAWSEMLTPQFVIPAASYYPAARQARPNFIAYGLGWFLQDYRGRKVAMHTGSIDGMSAIVGMMPEERLGVVVLANLDHAELRHAVMYRVFDLYLGGAGKDWSADLRKLYGDAAAKSKAAQRKKEQERIADTRPTLGLPAYAGTYADSLYGDIVVSVENGQLVARFGPNFVGPLEHWHYDTFRARWQDPTLGRSFVTFGLDAAGRVSDLTMEGVGEFERGPDPQTAPEAALTRPVQGRPVRRSGS